MIFNNVKGHPDAKVAIGVLASRKRVGYLLGCQPSQLGFLLKDSVQNPIPPVTIPQEKAKCQEVVHLATDPDFDLNRLVRRDEYAGYAGPYITLGMCYASHPDTGLHDVTIHRLCIQGKDELSIFFTRAHATSAQWQTARRNWDRHFRFPSVSVLILRLRSVPVSSRRQHPLGYDELSVAGALRKEPVELCRCVSVKEMAIANAEYVIEGEVIPGVRVQEDQNSHTGYAMPEFPGYTGPASDQCRLIKVKAVTHRRSPIMQTCIGPSEEHVSMAGIPTEASIYSMVEKAMRDGSRMCTAVPQAAESIWRFSSSKN